MSFTDNVSAETYMAKVNRFYTQEKARAFKEVEDFFKGKGERLKQFIHLSAEEKAELSDLIPFFSYERVLSQRLYRWETMSPEYGAYTLAISCKAILEEYGIDLDNLPDFVIKRVVSPVDKVDL